MHTRCLPILFPPKKGKDKRNFTCNLGKEHFNYSFTWFFPSGGVNIYNQVLFKSTETLIFSFVLVKMGRE